MQAINKIVLFVELNKISTLESLINLINEKIVDIPGAGGKYQIIFRERGCTKPNTFFCDKILHALDCNNNSKEEIYEKYQDKMSAVYEEVREKFYKWREQHRDSDVDSDDEMYEDDGKFNENEKINALKEQRRNEFQRATLNHYRNVLMEKLINIPPWISSLRFEIMPRYIDSISFCLDKINEVLEEKNKDLIFMMSTRVTRKKDDKLVVFVK